MRRTKGARALLIAAAAFILAAAGTTAAWAAERLGTIEDNYWDEDSRTIARWEEIEDAYQYEVYLYRDESHVATVKTKKESYNFKNKITKAGDYTFRVRALASGSSRKNGSWSDYAESTYFSEDYVQFLEDGGVIDTLHTGPGAINDGSQEMDTVSVVYTPQWIQEEAGWRYRQSDGSYQANGWWLDSAAGVWYYFDANGYMVTGWVSYNDAWYYLLPSGAMATGTQTIDGTVYQFDYTGILQAS